MIAGHFLYFILTLLLFGSALAAPGNRDRPPLATNNQPDTSSSNPPASVDIGREAITSMSLAHNSFMKAASDLEANNNQHVQSLREANAHLVTGYRHWANHLKEQADRETRLREESYKTAASVGATRRQLHDKHIDVAQNAMHAKAEEHQKNEKDLKSRQSIIEKALLEAAKVQPVIDPSPPGSDHLALARTAFTNADKSRKGASKASQPSEMSDHLYNAHKNTNNGYGHLVSHARERADRASRSGQLYLAKYNRAMEDARNYLAQFNTHSKNAQDYDLHHRNLLQAGK